MSEKLRILIVEDRQEDTELMLHALREGGLDFDHTRVDNELHFLSELNKNPDVIISDYSLPQFDGLAALQILRKSKMDIPFILVSGTIGEETAVAAIKAGVHDYIMKDHLKRVPEAIKRELKDAEIRKRLKESEEQYQHLVELSPDAILIQVGGIIKFINRAGYELFGAVSAHELLEKSIFDYIHPDFHEIVKKRIHTTEVDRQICAIIEEKFIKKDGTIVDVEVLSAPFIYNGMPAMQVFARDITVRANAEEKIKKQNIELKEYISRNKELKYADLMKSEFLATTSHELRTPLTAIIGFSEVLKDGLVGPLTDKQKEYCFDIYRSGQHLLAMINDLLDLSKADSGKMELEIEKVNLEELLEETLVIVREKAKANNIQLKCDITGTLGTTLYDPRKLNQIIYNLLSNAVKFTPDGSTVTLAATVQGGNLLEISVSDMGVGISEENLKRLFQPFEQIRHTHPTREKGTGLGLMIAKRLTELHSGTISVESTVGKGT